MTMHSRKERSRMTRDRAGFTLIEIMLVVVILGILAGVGVVALKGRTAAAARAATRTTIQAYCQAINLFELDCGALPGSLQELVNDPGNGQWQGPYFPNGRLPQDAWGHEPSYSKTEKGYTVSSAGPDGQPGTADDLTN